MVSEEVSFIVVFTRDGGCCRIALSEEGLIDAAVSKWVDSGKTIDTLLCLTLALGHGMYRVLASEITSWLDSTPESREASRKVDELMKTPGWKDDAD